MSEERPYQEKIKTDFFDHQAKEVSAPITKQLPVMILLGFVAIAVLFGLFQLSFYFINFDKNVAMRNIEIHIQNPIQKDGVATVDVRINNLNAVAVKDLVIGYTLTNISGVCSNGKLPIPDIISAGASKVYTKMRLQAVPSQGGKMHAELLDLNTVAKAK